MHALLALKVATVVAFWVWWFEPGHEVSVSGLIVVSAIVSYGTLRPAFFFLAASRIRKVNSLLPVPDLRVAIVVTKAPSEPWSVVKATLEGALSQRYPRDYDVWLCDEQPATDALEWCSANGVHVSTRQGVEAYHQPTWPRKSKCKEGNLAYFYDHWGYEQYDVVAQFDADHVPAPGYLTNVVIPFADPQVSYVAAPSVCDTNAGESWAARGRLYTEAGLHGPQQAGCNDRLAPICFGSHYVVRTEALRGIGGIGPELAEDFTTTFLMVAHGWRGAFALGAEAHGEGPPTFAAMATQEFQWARSMTVVLFDLLPKNLRRMSWGQRFRFGYTLTYYPLLALFSVASVLLAPIGCLTAVQWIRVPYQDFLFVGLLVASSTLMMNFFLRHKGLLRPRNAPILSWEVALYSVTRWPFVVQGVLAGVIGKLTHRQPGIRVTPKGPAAARSLGVRLVLPLLAVSALCTSAAIVGTHNATVQGNVLISLLTSGLLAVAALAVCLLHGTELVRHSVERGSTRLFLRAVGAPLIFSIGVAAAFATACVIVVPTLQLGRL